MAVIKRQDKEEWATDLIYYFTKEKVQMTNTREEMLSYISNWVNAK